MSEQLNPYSPTDAPLLVQQQSFDVTLVLASRWRRFWTYVIDWVLSMVALSLLALTGYEIFLVGSGKSILSEFLRSSMSGLVVLLIYYVPQELMFGWTVGKLILRTRVVGVDSDPADFLQILGRTLARMIPFEALSFFGSKPFGWHDSLSNTRVVCLRKLERLRAGEVESLIAERDEWFQGGLESAPARPPDWNSWSDAKKAVWEMEQQSTQRANAERRD
ncbi:MAG: RDD family protein [Betaproteobacteria bacterium]|nr:RDD family protein [Betaproteobacteria bacterium]